MEFVVVSGVRIMATNVYFSPKVKTEQNLYEDLVIESLKMYGQDTYYLPRTILQRDYIMNEDVESQFDDAYTIEMYIENTEGFGGEGDLMSKFGLEIRDTATFIVAKRRWEQAIGFWNSEDAPDRPLEGDVIYLPLSQSFFQIDKVEHEQPFYQLNNLPTYKLQCSLFEMGSETFDTGVEDIDRIDARGYQNILNLEAVSSYEVSIGETVTQSLTEDLSISGEVVYVEKGELDQSLTVSVVNITTSNGSYAEFKEGLSVQFSSGITGILTDTGINEGNDGSEVYDPFAQNTNFESEANSILDFSETNPFGEPS
jgi:hypothetical protein